MPFCSSNIIVSPGDVNVSDELNSNIIGSEKSPFSSLNCLLIKPISARPFSGKNSPSPSSIMELRAKGISYRLNDAPSVFIKSILEASSFSPVDMSNDSFAPIATSLYLTNTLIAATPALLSELY